MLTMGIDQSRAQNAGYDQIIFFNQLCYQNSDVNICLSKTSVDSVVDFYIFPEDFLSQY